MSTNSFYAQRSNNVAKTWLFMALIIGLFTAVGFFLAYYYQNVNILYGAIIFSLVMNISSYWFSDRIALSMAGATELKSKSQYPEFWNVVENLAEKAGLPMPRLYVINDPIPNAFATGRNKNHSAVAATTGILSALNKNELEGVVGHELSHIANKDILLQTIVVIMVSSITFLAQMFYRVNMMGGIAGGERREGNGGIFMLVGSILAVILAPIAASVIQLAISRRREFLADASGAMLTNDPEGLASALAKISQYRQPLQNANSATAHMYIVNPMGLNAQDLSVGEQKVPWFARLFMTHPPTSERIKALLSMKD